MQELEMSRKSWVFRGGLVGWYMVNLDKLDEIISNPDSPHRIKSHKNRDFTTCDLFWGWVFNVVFWWWAMTFVVIFISVILFAVSIIFDVGRFLLGYRPEWEFFLMIKNIFSKDFSMDYEVFSFDNARPLFRGMKNRFLYLRPIYFLCWGVFLYGIVFVGPPLFVSSTNDLFYAILRLVVSMIVMFSGIQLVSSLFGELKKKINLRRCLRKQAKFGSSENAFEIGKAMSELAIIWRAFHDRTCIKIKVKD